MCCRSTSSTFHVCVHVYTPPCVSFAQAPPHHYENDVICLLNLFSRLFLLEIVFDFNSNLSACAAAIIVITHAFNPVFFAFKCTCNAFASQAMYAQALPGFDSTVAVATGVTKHPGSTCRTKEDSPTNVPGVNSAISSPSTLTTKVPAVINTNSVTPCPCTVSVVASVVLLCPFHLAPHFNNW